MSEKLIDKIKMKKVRVVVLSLGHVGLPTPAIFAEAGYSVPRTDIKR